MWDTTLEVNDQEGFVGPRNSTGYSMTTGWPSERHVSTLLLKMCLGCWIQQKHTVTELQFLSYQQGTGGEKSESIGTSLKPGTL